MRRWAFIAMGCLSCLMAFAQEDSLTQVEYDTVVVNQPPVIINRKVLSLPDKIKTDKPVFIGLSVGLNYFTSFYYTCKDCGRYDAYTKTIDSSVSEIPGINVTAHLYRNFKRNFFYGATLGYSLYRERFSASGISANNNYHQLSISASIFYQLYSSEKSKLFIGLGGNARYLLAASGKTVTIYKTNQVDDLNSFRVFHKLLGGVQISAYWLRALNSKLSLLVYPEVAFDITSFTSYHEYYLQNRLLYSLNLGLIRKM